MKKILFILLLLISIITNAQNGFYGSYIYKQEYDTITYRYASDRPRVHCVTYSGDSLNYNVLTFPTVSISGDSTATQLQSNFIGETHYLSCKHNDLKTLIFNGFNARDINVSKCRTLQYLEVVDAYMINGIDVSNLNALKWVSYNSNSTFSTLDFSNNIKLERVSIVYDNTPSIIVNSPLLKEIFIAYTTLTSVSLGNPNANTEKLYFYGDALIQSEVDEILKWCMDGGRTSMDGSCYVELRGGTNSCPSETGVGYVQVLTNRGWVVNYNQCGGGGGTTNPPSIITAEPTYISTNSAVSGGNVTSQGDASVTARGVCWNTSTNPTISNSHTVDGTGIGNFTSTITGLSAGTLYYVRAYATNSYGTSYGNQYTFTTVAEFTNPTLTTNIPSGVSTNTATSGGHITSDGGGEIVEKGVCYSTSPNPTYSSSKTNDGSGIADFISTISGLSPNTTYYVRAYARNRVLSGGFYIYALGYGQEESFTTTGSGTLPTVSTYSANTITASSAYSGGNISSEGDSNVTLRGVCYSTSQNPTIINNKTNDGSGTGSFTSSLTGLTCGTTYYVRAYATNSSGTAYGNQVSFATEICTYTPTVTINTVSKYGDTYATFSGSVTNDGNSMVTERGFVYSTTPNPTTSSNKIISGSGVGVFSANAYGLFSSTKYYVRAYAINNVGTAYSNELDFITFESPTNVSISTSVPVNITTNSAILGGNISSDGGNTVTERGVVYGLSINPTTSNTKIQSGDGIGIYSVNVTGLTQGTTYHVRAYAINSNGTFYGADESFITSIDGATACNAGQTFPGGQSYPSTNTIVLGSGTGDVTLTFSAYDYPDFFLVEYNSTIYNSGWRGSSIYDYGGNSRSAFKSALWGKIDPTNPSFPTTFPNITLYPEDGYPRVNSATGNIYFTKSTNNPTTAIVKVYAPMSGTRWSYILSCPN